MSKYKIDWSKHQDILKWKEVAEEKQKFYCAYLGKSKWEVYDANDSRYLKLKIGYALFGPPLNLQEKDIERTYRDANHKTKIDYIMSVIKNGSENVLYLNFIYFIAIIENKYSEFPLIRVLKRREEGRDVCFFVDALGYKYKSWEKFLNSNAMPKCIYCYPSGGFYTCDERGKVQLDYGYSPQTYSIISKGIGVMSAVGSAVTGVLPVTSQESKAIVAESIVKGVADKALSCWLEVADVEAFSSVFAVHSTRAVAASLYQCERINPFLADTLAKGPLRPNWFAVLNMMPEILKHTHRITYTHTAQLFVSLLFFCHAVVSYDTCKQLLKETFEQITNNAKIDLSDKPIHFLKEMRDKIIKKSVDEVILRIKRIDNKADLGEQILEKIEGLDENGNFAFKNVLEELKATCKENDSPKHKIVNYCFFLEDITKNCSNCCDKIKETKKYMYGVDELSDIEIYMQEYEKSQSLIKTECSVRQGTTQVFVEHIANHLQPMDYYKMFVNEKIKQIKPVQFYPDCTETDAESWLFILPEEKYDLKMIKIKMVKIADETACVKVFYY